MAEQKKQNGKQDTNNNKEKTPLPYSGGVFAIISLAFIICTRIIFIILISIGIELALSAIGVYSNGTGHSKDLLIHYYGYLLDDHSDKKYMIDPLNNALYIINYISSLLSINLQSALTHSHSGFSAYLYVIYYAFCTVLIKLSYVASSLPLFAIVWLCMVMDGFVQRTKRKYIGTPDSVYKWTISIHMIGVPLFGLMFLYLVLPLSIHPAFWLLPITFVSGYGWRAITINFNKFL